MQKLIHKVWKNSIIVKVGVCEAEASKSLQPYLHHRKTGKPFVVVKTATSLDGKIACQDGTSKWITGPEARKNAHYQRAASQAILVGAETALADNPMLNVRDIDVDVKPLRVVLDSRGRVTTGHLLDLNIGPTLIFTSNKAPSESLRLWEEKKVEFLIVDSDHNGLNLPQVLSELGKRGILQLLIEGGGKVHSSFLKQDLTDLLVFYHGACLIGATGKSWAQDSFASTMADVKKWNIREVKQFGNDICVEYLKISNQ